MELSLYLVTVFLTLCSQIVVEISCDDSYTEAELNAIEEFRPLIEDGLTKDYMHENKYLIRWLRTKNLNVKVAEEFIRRNFAWRKENKLDLITTENWSQFERDYPFNFRTVDYEGRPALTSKLGQINVRRLILSGQRLEIRRYIVYGFERAVLNIHKVSNETGKEFIDSHLLFNMAGYNLRTHSCIQCVSGWITLVTNYENYYPQLAHTMIIINTPRIFEALWQIMRPFASPHTQKVLKLYGVNKLEWRPVLNAIYPDDQLSPEYGGTAKY